MTTGAQRAAGRHLFFILLIVALAGFVTLLVLELGTTRQREEAAAARNARNVARVLEQHTLATIGKIDNTLLDIVAEYGPYLAGDKRSPEDINTELRRYLGHLPESQSLRVADAQGRFIFDASGELSSATIADRAYFQTSRDNPGAGLVISEPIFARITKNWVITLSRRFNHADGRFAGVVQAAVRADYFQSFYQTLDIGPGGVVGLYDTHLRMVARHPAVNDRIGMPLRNSPAEKPLRAEEKESVYHGPSSLDGRMRLWAFRRVEGMPFFVLVGISHDTLYAEWRRTAWIYSLGAAALVLALLGLAALWQRSYSRAMDEAQDMSAAFARSHSRNRALLDSIPDFAWLSDTEGRFVAVNQTYAGALGRRRDELVGQSAEAVWPPETAALLEGWQRSVLAAQGPARFESDIVIPGQGVRHIETILVPVRDAAGAVTGTAGVARDITERKQAERALQELNETLEQRVKEEVAKNREKDHILIQQSRLAAMGEMVHNIAHQWRQPINALRLLLENIRDAYAYGELDQAYLDRAVGDGDRLIQKMSTTIDDFRHFFSPSKERTRFSLSQAVKDALSILEASLHSHGVKVEVDEVEDAAVLGYPNEYAQVLLNLLSNAKEAVQARGREDGVIRVRVEADAREGRVIVSDDGGGIPADILDMVFDPYFTTKDKGTGIGLYMSRMIVEGNMGGRLTVRNTEEGAEFTVALPRADG